MNAKSRKTLTGVIVFLMLVELTTATGYLRSNSSSIVLQPADNQVLPNTDSAVNLGSPSNKWKKVYVGGINDGIGVSDTDVSMLTLTRAGNRTGLILEPSNGYGGLRVDPVSGLSYMILIARDGQSDWRGIRFLFVNTSGYGVGDLFVGGDANGVRLRPTASKLNIEGNVLPTADNIYNLGSSGYRWKNVFGSQFSFDNDYYIRTYSGNTMVFGKPYTSGNTMFTFWNVGGNISINPAWAGMHLASPAFMRNGSWSFPRAFLWTEFVNNTNPDSATFTIMTGNAQPGFPYHLRLISASAKGNIILTPGSGGAVLPEIDKAYDLGTPSNAWAHVNSYNYTTKSSRTYVVDFKSKYGRTAVDMISGIGVDSKGLWRQDTIPASYKAGSFWQVSRTVRKTRFNPGANATEEYDDYQTQTYENYSSIPAADKPLAEQHSLIDLNARDDTCEAAIRELNAKIKVLQTELCLKNPKYAFCTPGVL